MNPPSSCGNVDATMQGLPTDLCNANGGIAIVILAFEEFGVVPAE